MKYLASFRRLSWLLVFYLVLLLVLISTDPYRSPLLVVVVPFGLIFIALFMTINSLMKLTPGVQRLSSKKRLFIAAAAAWLPVMLLILRSIDQLTVRDGLIMIIFVLALLVYTSRTNFTRR